MLSQLKIHYRYHIIRMGKQIKILAALSALMLCSCASGGRQEMRDDKAVSGPEVNEVEVIVLERGDFSRQLISNGKLKAARRASLAFGTGGTISALRVSNGSRISAGNVIASLDRPDLKLAKEAAEIAVRKAELELYDVLAGQGHALKDTVSVPREVLEMAKMRSGYTSALNALAKARLDYESSVLKAPFSGRIADMETGMHDRVGTEPFCTVMDDSSLDVDFYVMESEYPFLSEGLSVKIIPFADRSKTIKGRLTGINPTVNKSGQIAVRARVPNDGTLLDGMNVKVVVERTLPDQLVVPRSAVVVRDKLDVLFTYTDDGIAHWVYVTLLESNGESFAVTANADRNASLSEGDKVIISGNINLADGSKVSLKK